MPQPVVRRNIDGEPVEKRCGRKTGVEQDERCETYVYLDVVYCAPHQDEFNQLEQAVVTAQNNLETALGSVETAQSDLNLATEAATEASDAAEAAQSDLEIKSEKTLTDHTDEAELALDQATDAKANAQRALDQATEAKANAQTALDEATEAKANAQTALDEATQALSSWEFFNVTNTY